MKTSNKRLFDIYKKYKDRQTHTMCAYEFLGDTDFDIDDDQEIKVFVDAILDGEEIELEEPKYYVKLTYLAKEDCFLNDRFGHYFFSNKNSDESYKTQFTEQEVKGKFPNFWKYAVKVEEES